jgi:hypothetical protein
LQQQQTLQKINEENEDKGREVVSKELYYHVMRLDNDLRDRDRVIDELRGENKTLEKLLKATEDDLLKLHVTSTGNAIPDQNAITIEQKVVMLENRVRELLSTIQELQQENRTLLRIQQAKTQAIEQLTQELNTRGATDEYVEELRRIIQAIEKDLNNVLDENAQLMKIAKAKEDIIERFQQQEGGIPYNLWLEERKLLQVCGPLLKANH